MSPVAAELEDVVLEKEWKGGLRCVKMRLQTADVSICEGTRDVRDGVIFPADWPAARSALLAREGWDVENDGLFGAPPIEVIVGEEYHASMQKAPEYGGIWKESRDARADGRRKGGCA